MEFAFCAWALDEFESGAADGAQVVIEIPDGAGEVAMAEERLHVAGVVGVLVHADCGGAAEVVGAEVLADGERGEESAESAVDGVAGGIDFELSAAAGGLLAEAELLNVGERRGVVAGVEDGGDFSGDREGEGFVTFGEEAELATARVVVGRTDAGGGAGTHGEVGTEEEPQADVIGRGGEDGVYLLLRHGDVARAESRMLGDHVIERRGSVLLPEVTEDAADTDG